MTRARLVLGSCLLVALGAGVGVVACTPAQEQAFARDVQAYGPAVVRGACILLRALGDDGAVREVCARADDLLPLIEEIRAVQVERPAATVAAPLVLDSPAPRRAPRRRCVAWRKVGADDGGSDDGGRDAARD